MGLAAALKQMGNTLGLIKVVELPAPEKPQKVATRTVTLKDLITQVRADDLRGLAESPAELTVGFTEVFAAAGIQAPAHGWTVERLAELVNSEPYLSQARDAAQKAVLGVLQAQKVPVEDLVKDALARDHAIDAYGAFVHGKMKSRREDRARQKADLEAQIQDLRTKQAQLQDADQRDQNAWRTWWQKKLAYEKGMAGAIGYVLSKPVVTVDEQPPADDNSQT